jgi:hypothetical protein
MTSRPTSTGPSSRFLNAWLKFVVLAAEPQPGPRAREPSHFHGQSNVTMRKRPVRDDFIGEIENVQASLIDGLLEL